MKCFLVFVFSLLCATMLWSQPDFWSEFNIDRIHKQQTAMKILGTWAAGNIIIGSIMVGKTNGATKGFHQMNIGWNAVNLAIAGFGWYATSSIDPNTFDAYTSLQENYKLQKILLFNAGLDVGYMAGGAYLIERSKNTNKHPERLKGWGQSLLLQGGFLFAFDLTAYIILAQDNDKLKPIINQLSFTPNGVGLLLNF